MSKKPVPSKKQCPSSTGSRHGTYVRKARVRMQNEVALDVCKKCGATKRRHFVCQECGWYGDTKIFDVKAAKTPTQEIKA